MITTEERKGDDLIQTIQLHEKAPVVLNQVFSNQELEQIRSIRDEAYKDQARCAEKLLNQGTEPLGKMAHPNQELKQKLEELVRPKLKNHAHKKFEMDFSFHRNFFPYGIHTDSGYDSCLLYTSPSPRDQRGSRMPSSA